MQRSRGPRLFPIFIILVVVVIIIIGIVSLGRAFFGGNKPAAPTTDTAQNTLLKVDDQHSVQLTVRGPITAQETFTSYTVDVSPTSRAMTVYEGYLDSVKKSRSLSNNREAYTQFVYALDKANMMKGSALSGDKNDLRGICASGYVYEYAVLENGQPTKMLWTSTCSGSKGSLDASVTQLDNLFHAQIPDFGDLNPFRTTGLPTKL